MKLLKRFREKWKEVDRWVSQRMKQKYDSEVVEKAAEARLDKLDGDEDA